MPREVFKYTVLARFLSVLAWILSLNCGLAYSLPLTDNYLATSRNLVDDIQNSTMNFDNVYSVAPSTNHYTKIKERILPYTGIPAGVQVAKADGSTTNISSWAENGFVIEFTVASVDGGFIAFAPYSTSWAVKFQDIDLEPLAASTPEVLGIYFDFTNSSQELPYNLDPLLLSSVPIGVGKHPLENQDVIYSTSTGTSFNNYAFASITNNKLLVNIDSQVQFESFSLDSIVKALGVSANFNQAPKVNIFKVGVLVKGIQVNALHVLPGDYNCDLSVDGADFIIWQKRLGSTNVGPCSGDGDYDGDVDHDDYNVWRANFGSVYQPPAPAAGSSLLEVPTPTPLDNAELQSVESTLGVVDTIKNPLSAEITSPKVIIDSNVKPLEPKLKNKKAKKRRHKNKRIKRDKKNMTNKKSAFHTQALSL